MEVYVDNMLVKSKDEANHLDDLKETFSTLHKYDMKLNPAKCVFAVASRKFLRFMVSQWGRGKFGQSKSNNRGQITKNSEGGTELDRES